MEKQKLKIDSVEPGILGTPKQLVNLEETTLFYATRKKLLNFRKRLAAPITVLYNTTSPKNDPISRQLLKYFQADLIFLKKKKLDQLNLPHMYKSIISFIQRRKIRKKETIPHIKIHEMNGER